MRFTGTGEPKGANCAPEGKVAHQAPVNEPTPQGPPASDDQVEAADVSKRSHASTSRELTLKAPARVKRSAASGESRSARLRTSRASNATRRGLSDAAAGRGVTLGAATKAASNQNFQSRLSSGNKACKPATELSGEAGISLTRIRAKAPASFPTWALVYLSQSIDSLGVVGPSCASKTAKSGCITSHSAKSAGSAKSQAVFRSGPPRAPANQAATGRSRSFTRRQARRSAIV